MPLSIAAENTTFQNCVLCRTVLKFELKTIPNVAEVASVGGVVKQYQIQLDPVKLTQYDISCLVKQALSSSNQEAGGSSVEIAESEYMVRASGYLQTIDDFKNIVLKTGKMEYLFTCVMLPAYKWGPEMRRGIAELNGQGEVALRSGDPAFGQKCTRSHYGGEG